MGLSDFRESLAEEIQEITSSDFTVEIAETDLIESVPAFYKCEGVRVYIVESALRCYPGSLPL
jgi:hypothetical protein